MAALSRRGFLAGTASAALLAACSSSSTPRTASTASASVAGGLPDPGSAPFDTVVVLMMENRSFDHLLGWVPGANGKQAGLTFPDHDGNQAPTVDLGADVQGCSFKDPPHQWPAVAKQFNNGACDGWLLAEDPPGDHFPIGYYTAPQVPILGALAQNYTLFDNYFCSMQGGTWPNRLYQLCAASDIDVTGFFPGADQPRPSNLQLAIFDRVLGAGRSAGYYSWGEPMTGLFASKRYDSISFPKDQFFTDAAAGRLPNVAFIEPDYTLVPELTGTSNDDHPHGSILSGEGWIAAVYNALRSSPQWDRMVFVLNFDEHGGFYDHVAPPTVVDDNVNPNPGPHPDFTRLGFRVPAIAMGPFAPKKIESGGPYEHCSILSMIEWRFGLSPMTARDKNAPNLAEALDFSTRRDPFELPAFTPPPAVACPQPS
jgi:phospholipase C